MTQGTTTIRASVGQKVLKRAVDLFDHSPKTIFSELFQNARRADAKNIRIDLVDLGSHEGLQQTAITLVDDGTGITDPKALVAFGGSDWDLALDERESAAGMGFFSLAAFGVTVQSLTWKARITVAAFAGTEDILVVPASARTGTQLDFVLPHTIGEITRAIHEEGTYLPAAVRIGDTLIPQKRFLADAIDVTEVLGVRIGVFAIERDFGKREESVNFFGHVVSINDRETYSLPSVEEAAHRPNPDRIRYPHGKKLTYVAKIDVVDAPDLKLVLPTRDKIINNDAWKTIRAAAERAIYAGIAKQSDHLLGYRSWQRAKTLNVTLNAPKAIPLQTYEVGNDDDGAVYRPKNARTFFIDGNAKTPPPKTFFFPEAERPMQMAIGAAIDDVTLPYTMLDEQPSFAGYPGYDAIPHASFSVTVKTATESIETDEFGFQVTAAVEKCSESYLTYYFVDGIDIQLVAGTHQQTFAIDALVITEGRAESAEAIIRKTADVLSVVTAIMDQSWEYDDDDQENAREDAETYLTRHLRDLMLSSTQARSRTIRDLVFGEMQNQLMGNTKKLEPTVVSLEFQYDPFSIKTTFSDGTVVNS